MEDASAPGTAAAFDRSAAERTDPDLITRLSSDADTRVLVNDADRAPVDAAGQLVLVTVSRARDILAAAARRGGAPGGAIPRATSESTAAASPADAGSTDAGSTDVGPGGTDAGSTDADADADADAGGTDAGSTDAGSTDADAGSTDAGGTDADSARADHRAPLAFLGRRRGAAVLVAAVPGAADAESAGGAAWEWSSLRTLHPALDAADADMVMTAVSVSRWLVDAGFCPFCGGVARLTTGGWARSCEACGREHFPRTDPAVIVAVTDGDRLLLGSNAMWEQRRYSCFAGFVESGESLEDAVRREVFEESGIEVESVTYIGSQAWPFPRSLMLGFRAQARDARTAHPDGEEILDVRWFTRAEVRDVYAGASDLLLPGRPSIAHELISGWAAEPDTGGPTVPNSSAPGERA